MWIAWRSRGLFQRRPAVYADSHFVQHWARLVYLLNLHESYFGLSLEGLPFFPENS
jgi:hypothetical protein